MRQGLPAMYFAITSNHKVIAELFTQEFVLKNAHLFTFDASNPVLLRLQALNTVRLQALNRVYTAQHI